MGKGKAREASRARVDMSIRSHSYRRIWSSVAFAMGRSKDRRQAKVTNLQGCEQRTPASARFAGFPARKIIFNASDRHQDIRHKTPATTQQMLNSCTYSMAGWRISGLEGFLLSASVHWCTVRNDDYVESTDSCAIKAALSFIRRIVFHTLALPFSCIF